MTCVGIIDLGMGNIFSISSALDYLGASIKTIHSARELVKVDRLILPGVGAFPNAMKKIQQLEISDLLKEMCFDGGTPILGICLGMQLLCKRSDEIKITDGLGFIDSRVKPFDSDLGIKLPHVGFNSVDFSDSSVLYRGLKQGADFYFTHSYRMKSSAADLNGFCYYGEKFIASYEDNNIFGVQFHPEKSQTNGLQLLKNFLDYA